MKKAPNKKRETAACGSACLRAAAPPSSLASFLSSFGGFAASFSCPLRASLSSCGRLRRPSSLLLLSRFFRAAGAALSLSTNPFLWPLRAPLSHTKLTWSPASSPSTNNPGYAGKEFLCGDFQAMQQQCEARDGTSRASSVLPNSAPHHCKGVSGVRKPALR